MNATTIKQKQSFTLNDPTAATVLLVGDFTHWLKRPIPLKKNAEGMWKAQLSLAPGDHHYWFLVDGEWRGAPMCELLVTNPFGTRGAVSSGRLRHN